MEFDPLKETFAILSDPRAVDEIRKGVAEVKAGDTVSAKEVRSAMVATGRFARRPR